MSRAQLDHPRFDGAAHEERAWRARAEVPLQFLLSK
jgi:hypothetical protein